MQLVSWPHRPRPAHFVESGADDAARGIELAFHEKAHGHRRGMPAARSQSPEERVAGAVLVQMKGLRIEFRGEGLDARGLDRKPARAEFLSRLKILEISHH